MKGELMSNLLDISFRNVDGSDAVTEKVNEKFAKLQALCDQIMSCHVIIEALNKNQNKGNLFSVSIDLAVPNQKLVVSHASHKDHAHEDVYVALRDAFDAMTKQLETYLDKRRNNVKHHAEFVPVVPE